MNLSLLYIFISQAPLVPLQPGWCPPHSAWCTWVERRRWMADTESVKNTKWLRKATFFVMCVNLLVCYDNVMYLNENSQDDGISQLLLGEVQKGIN